MANPSLDNTNKKLLIAGVPVSVLGGIADSGIRMEPQGDRRVAVRGLYGDGAYISQQNDGHWKIMIDCLETSELNTKLHIYKQTNAVVPVVHEDGGKTVLSGTAMVMNDPTLGIQNTVQVHTWILETMDFKGTIGGRSF